ncbi:MAG: hypothetical protein ACREVI_09880 [Steroidobacteraceae bacterium]
MTLVIFAGFVPQLPVAGTVTAVTALAFALFAGSLLVQLGFAAAVGILAFGVAGLAGAA